MKVKLSLLAAGAALMFLGASCQRQAPTTEVQLNKTTKPVEQELTPAAGHTVATIKTSKGEIKIELYDDTSPKTVKNFLDLVAKGFYDDLLFHRVIPDFMIQVGDPLTKSDPKNFAVHGTGGPGYTIPDEFNSLPFFRGAIGMAKTGAPNSGGSQFFITTGDATFLNGQYTNFGRVLSGMDVADVIVNAPRNDNDHPLEDIKILGITINK